MSCAQNPRRADPAVPCPVSIRIHAAHAFRFALPRLRSALVAYPPCTTCFKKAYSQTTFDLYSG
jgi:hypothetical protein